MQGDRSIGVCDKRHERRASGGTRSLESCKKTHASLPNESPQAMLVVPRSHPSHFAAHRPSSMSIQVNRIALIAVGAIAACTPAVSTTNTSQAYTPPPPAQGDFLAA